MEHDRAGRCELAPAFHPVGDEAEFRRFLRAPAQPEIETARGCFAGLPVVGNDEAVGLHGAVDFGNVAAHDEAGRGVPRGLAVAQFLRALAAERELLPRGVEVFRLEELVVAQRPIHGLVKDHHVRQQREQRGLGLERHPQRVDLFAQRSDLRRERGAIGVGNGDAGRRDRFHLRGENGTGE